MKLLLTIALTAVVSLTCSAQIVPKSRLVGVTLRASSQYYPNAPSVYSSTNLNFEPSFGKFLNEKWLFSFGPEYYYSTLASAHVFQSSRMNSHVFGANANVTRFVPMLEKLYFTLGGGLYSRVGFTKTETTSFNGTISNSEDEVLYTGLTFSPGFAYYLNSKWIITAGFGFLNYDLSIEDNSTIHRLNFNLSTSSLGFGFRYVLGAKN